MSNKCVNFYILMRSIPTKLADLKLKEAELKIELSQLMKSEEINKLEIPRLFKVEKNIEIAKGILMLVGCLIVFLFRTALFDKNNNLLVAFVIIRFIFCLIAIGAIVLALFDLFNIDFLVARIFGVPFKDYHDFKKKRKTYQYSLQRIKSDLDIVELRIKRIYKGKNK